MQTSHVVKGLVLAGLGYLTYQGYQANPNRILKYATCGAVVGMLPSCPSTCCCNCPSPFKITLPWPVHFITGIATLIGLAYRPDATRALSATSLALFATNAIFRRQ